MSRLLVSGGNPLQGRVKVGGAKNSAVAILPATLLASTPSTLENLPLIGDVNLYAHLLQQLGAVVSTRAQGELTIDPSSVVNLEIADGFVHRMRASYYLLGVLLAKNGRAVVGLPGGCDIGLRPVDQHLKAFEALGARIEVGRGMVTLEAPCLYGNSIYLDVVSVGATINTVLAASLAKGTTVIENAAREPEVVDVANFLNAMGGQVKGAGTDTIRVVGVPSLTGTTHAVIPDRIEAGTYIAAALATGGDVTVENVIPKHLEPIVAKLREAGAQIIEDEESIRVIGNGKPRAVDIKTLPYPGFPTDMQAQTMALLVTADGTSVITEGVWERRFHHVQEFKRMGASINVDGRTAIVKGVDRLSGAEVRATDLRAGAALLVAGLAAEGTTEIHGVHHIDRGYERIEEKLRGLGAEITRRAGDPEELVTLLA